MLGDGSPPRISSPSFILLRRPKRLRRGLSGREKRRLWLVWRWVMWGVGDVAPQRISPAARSVRPAAP